MADADNIYNLDGCYIWWNANNGVSEECIFKVGYPSTEIGSIDQDGDLEVRSLEMSYGVITTDVPPLWVEELSSLGDIVSFRKGPASQEKVLIKGDGEIQFSQSASPVLAHQGAKIIVHNSGSSGDILGLQKNGVEKILFTGAGKIKPADSVELKKGKAFDLDVDSSELYGLKLVSSPSTKTQLVNKDEAALSVGINSSNQHYMDLETEFVYVGRGDGGTTGRDSILAIYPKLNKGGISLNKGNMDISIRGHEVPPRRIEIYLGSTTVPRFTIDEQGVINWPVLTQDPSSPAPNDGDMWIRGDLNPKELRMRISGSIYKLEFAPA